MSGQAAESLSPQRARGVAALPFYYGWVNLLVAGIAMSATLPGRTHGLGLIAKELTDDPTLGVTELRFTALNFWAVLLGAAFCLPIGCAIDRIGCRIVLTVVMGLLGAVVLGMSRVTEEGPLFVTLLLVRGLGQGALSVVSIALVGKWFTRRLGIAMGVFSVLLAIGFIAGTLGVGFAVERFGWRAAWAGLGWTLIGTAIVSWLLTRDSPEGVGLSVEGEAKAEPAGPDYSAGQAIRTPAFWIFTLAMALFNLVWSAITLLQESLLQEHHLTKDTFVLVMAILVFCGLPANLLTGWALRRWSHGRLLALGMLVLSGSLTAFPFVNTPGRAVGYAVGLGISGGIITVIFFAVYGHAFGRSNLGLLQAIGQVVSVFASALGPVLLSAGRSSYGRSDPVFLAGAVIASGFALACWLVRLPARGEQV